EKDLGITLQYSNPDTGEIVESDVVINSNYPFVVVATEDDAQGDDGNGTSDGKTGKSKGSLKVKDCSAKYDVTSVVTHELGHFWGLGEDLIDGNATMFYSTSLCSVTKRELKADDVAAITSLYEAAPPATETSAAAGVGHCTVSAPGRSASPAGAGMPLALAVTGLLCGWGRRRQLRARSR